MASPMSRSSAILSYVGTVLKPELPSFMQAKSAKPARANKIAYLDGLRGMAALVVYLTHHAYYAHEVPALHRAFGWHGEYYFAAAPVIRLFFSGGALSVALFFIISGYVVSLGALNSLHKGDILKLANSLGTGLPRRFIRLYFPVLCITFIIGTSWHLFGIRSSNGATPRPRQTYGRELVAWVQDFIHLTYLWAPRALTFDSYNPHLWNIPAQFRGMLIVNSMLLCMLAFHSWGHGARLLACAGTIFYFLVPVDGWYNAEYVVGMMICDLDLLADKEMLPKVFYRCKGLLLGGWIWHILFFVGLWFAGVPRGVRDVETMANDDPGWFFIKNMTPPVTENPVWYWEFWSGVFMLLSVPRIPWVRAFFESSIPLYFGKLSFGLYLVHGPLLWTVGDRVYSAVGRVNSVAAQNIPEWVNIFPLPNWGPMGLEVNYIAAQCIMFPLTMWLASIAHKVLDEPSGQLANWLFDPKRYSTPPKSEEQLPMVEQRPNGHPA